MNWFEALILGIVQGFTEFLPISSSGHLILVEKLLKIKSQENLTFTVIVHGATVLSTLVIFRREIGILIQDVLKIKYNPSTQYVLKIAISIIPIAIMGLFFKSEVETLFYSSTNLTIVGSMLIITSILLGLTYYTKFKNASMSYKNAFFVGIAQALAILPGISRSGMTIATGLLLGVNKNEIAKFSFLMVIIPILGDNILKLLGGELTSASSNIAPNILLIGFISAFISGLIACKIMLTIVRNNKLIYFAIYCFILGLFTIILNTI